MSTTQNLNYAESPVRISRLAVLAFVFSIVGAVLCFLLVTPMLAFVIALTAGVHLGRNPALAGRGYVKAASTISVCAVFMGMLIALLMPSHGGEGHSPRSYCAANLRGIAQSMVVYSNDNNDRYPVVVYAPYRASLNQPAGKAGPRGAPALGGSVLACMWGLVTNGQVSAKQFICRSDPFANAAAPAQVADATGNIYDNFQRGDQVSYSFAYPWKADGTVGRWWKNETDASLPLMADMTPQQGTGTPVRNLTPLKWPADGRTWNSANHQGDGQTVGYGDGHAEFARSPDVGQDNDNIYSTSGRPSWGPVQYGGLPAGKSSPELMGEKAPFDVILMPVRNATMGGM